MDIRAEEFDDDICEEDLEVDLEVFDISEYFEYLQIGNLKNVCEE